MERARRTAIGALVALCLAISRLPGALPALAQDQAAPDAQSNAVPVMLWTIIFVLVAMLVLSLGYLYRRMGGAQDEVIPKTVDPYFAHEGQVDTHVPGELHPEMAHDAVGIHADQPLEPGEPGRGTTAPLPHAAPVAASSSDADAQPTSSH